jgi:tetratricopeptide (TPR) repeat protein
MNQEFFTTRKTNFIFAFILFVVSFLLYAQTISFDFTNFDDVQILNNNRGYIQSFSELKRLFVTDAFLTKESAFYRPLQNVSFQIDMFFSTDAWIFHLTNVLLFSAIIVCLFFFFKRFNIHPKLSFLGALVYAVHPLFVISVAWIPSRGDLMLTLFSVLAMISFIDFLHKKQWKSGLFTSFWFTLALFSKETATFLPILFIVYYFTEKRTFNRAYLYLLATMFFIGLGWLYLREQSINQNIVSTFTGDEFIYNLRNIPTSFSQLLIPYDSTPLPVFTVIKMLIGAIVILALVVLLIRMKNFKVNLFYVLWYFLLLAPSLFFRNSNVDYLEHRFLLPMIGIFVLLLSALQESKINYNSRIFKWGSVTLIILFAAYTFYKTTPYKTAEAYYDKTIKQGGALSLAYNNRGFIKSSVGYYEDALKDVCMALTINPKNFDAYNLRGYIYHRMGKYDEAMQDYNMAIRLYPMDNRYYFNRAMLKIEINDLKGALEDIEISLEVNPNYPDIYLLRSSLKRRTGDFDGALQELEQAKMLNRNLWVIYTNIGNVYNDKKERQNAIAYYKKAIVANKDYPLAYFNKAIVEKAMNNYEVALTDFTTYFKYDRGNPQAYYECGCIYGIQGEYQKAIDCFNKAIGISPKYVNAYKDRAIALCMIEDYSSAIKDCDSLLVITPGDQSVIEFREKAKNALLEKKNADK